jgi:serine/threonine-protein kinase
MGPATSTMSLRELFEMLVDFDADARARHLASLDLDSPTLRALRDLLDGDARALPVLDVPAAQMLECWQDQTALAAGFIGQCIGPFLVLDVIGHGGSALVLRAQRAAGDGVQTVALKLLRTGLYSADAQRRFAREQAILAQLSHPHIARLIEGGVSANGLPYIAMELVEGLPITDYAERHALAIPQRLRLALMLCRAVEAAHIALVVHRDLKPSNVLVAGDGAIKVLDFGIAKLLDDDSPQLATQAIMLTPEYAAPEQFDAGPITTATDVYALGVLLGELLSGQRLGGKAGVQASAQAQASPVLPRGLPERGVLVRSLRGDLDAIIATALAEEPARRYRSAGALADDVERYLSGRAVQAHPPSRWYRARKFIQRHRTGVLLTSLLSCATLVGLVLALWQADAARRSARLAEAEAARAATLRNFMFDAFAQAEPSTPGAMDATVVDVVERAIASVRVDRSADAPARVDLLIRLAQVLGARGKLARSAELLQETQTLAEATLAADDPLRHELELASVFNLVERGQLDTARERIERMLGALPAAAAALRARFLLESAAVAQQQGDFVRAQRDAEAAKELAQALADAELSVNALRTLGSVLMNSGQLDAAIPVLVDVLRRQRTRYGEEHVRVASAESTLSRAYRRAGDLTRAEQHARAAIAVGARAMPDDHATRSTYMNALAMILIERRAFDQALPLLDETIRIQSGTDSDAANLAANLSNRGLVLGSLERWQESVESTRRAREVLVGHGRAHEVQALRVRMNLGFQLAMAGQRAAGEAELERALAGLRATDPPRDELIASALERKLRIALDAGDLVAAQQQIDGVVRAASALGALPLWPGRGPALHAELLLAQGRVREAEQALDACETELGTPVRQDPLVAPTCAILRLIASERRAMPAADLSARRVRAEATYTALPFPPPYLVRLAQAAKLERRSG